jgi:hypothetical protein
MFANVLIDCLIKTSNVSLHPFDVLRLSRTTPMIRRKLMANKAYNRWERPNCVCGKCQQCTISFGPATILYQQYLSQFFEYGFKIGNTNFVQGQIRLDQDIGTWRNFVEILDGHDSRKVHLDMVYRPGINVVRLAVDSPYSFAYIDDSKTGSYSKPIQILEPENIEWFIFINARLFVNWSDFKSLTCLVLNFSEYVGELDVGVFPSTIVDLKIMPTTGYMPHDHVAKLTGSFSKCAVLKRMHIIKCAYSELFALPQHLEVHVSDTHTGISALEKLKCFAHVISKYGTFASVTLPANLEIYVQYANALSLPNSYEKIFSTHILNGSTKYLLLRMDKVYDHFRGVHGSQSIHGGQKFNIKFPPSLRILSAMSIIDQEQHLPNLEELHVFHTGYHNTFTFAIKNNWTMPKLRTLIFANIINCKQIPTICAGETVNEIFEKALDMLPPNLYHIIYYLPVDIMQHGKLPFITTAKNTTIHLHDNSILHYHAYPVLPQTLHNKVRDCVHSFLQSKHIILRRDTERSLSSEGIESPRDTGRTLSSEGIEWPQDQHILVTKDGLVDLFVM